MRERMSDVGHRILHDLLEASHNASPARLPEIVKGLISELGFRDVTVYIADLQQGQLVAVPRSGTLERFTRAIDDSQAGLCYRTTSLRVSEGDTGGLTLWLPMLDGIERVGVLELHTESLDAPALDFARSLTSVITLVVLSKYSFSDDFSRLQRSRRMQLSAEMVWAFLPPRSLRTASVTSTAVLEPAYDIGGDAFDHSLMGEVLHVSILDAMGNDLASGLSSSVALAGCRNARRSGFGLAELAGTVDHHIDETFPDHFCTGVFAELDAHTGVFSWINCGHPYPLLLRGSRHIEGAMDRDPELPLGFGPLLPPGDPAAGRTVHRAQLEPGDRVLLYTDGVVEARTEEGELFGLDNFVDFVLRATASGEPVYEAVRRLVRAVLGLPGHRFTDDATIVLVEWHPGGPEPVPETVP